MEGASVDSKKAPSKNISPTPFPTSAPKVSNTNVTLKTDEASPGENYKSLQWTQFDSVIAHLENSIVTLTACALGGRRFPLGSDGWFTTIFTIEGRALDSVFWPWLVCVLNAVYWVCLTNIGDDPVVKSPSSDSQNVQDFKSAFQLGLSGTLSFLLVFRLNRSILRFWEGVQAWGGIVVNCRSLVMSILIHGRDMPYDRDRAVVWIVATIIAAKKGLREFEIKIDDLKELLDEEDIQAINEAHNSPLYAANEVRYHLKKIFDVTKEFGPLSPARSTEMRDAERFLDGILSNIGRAENILQTPLPLVYVAHLRTFLMMFLLTLPYVVQPLWGWVTIPNMALFAFIMLGIEAVAVEVECPFEKGKVNDLDLDLYCAGILKDVQQLVKALNMREKS